MCSMCCLEVLYTYVGATLVAATLLPAVCSLSPVFSLLSGCGPLSPAQGCGKCINIYLVLMFVSINNGYY